MPLTELAVLAKHINENIDGLRGDITHLDARTNRNEQLVNFLIAALVTIVIFAGGLAWGYFRINSIVDNIEVSRVQVSCPLLASNLGSYNPLARNAGMDRDIYEANIIKMRNAYTNILHCTDTLVPQRNDLPKYSPPR